MSTTRGYGDRRFVDPKGATRAAVDDRPSHLVGRPVTLEWNGGTISNLVPYAEPTTPASTSAALQPDQILAGKFQIRRVLGAGGMGQVFEAKDLKLNRLVAIKVAWQHVGAEPLHREAQVMAAFRNAGLPTVYAIDAADGIEYLVMEHLNGSTLDDYLGDRRQTLPRIGDCLDLLEGICDALGPLHESGLAHADLKPANIMLMPRGRIVLLDFGVARIEQLRTHAQGVSGSPHYMAPEAFSGTVQAGAAHLVDLYALGIIAFVMLTGTAPFDHANPLALMAMHLGEPAPRLIERRADAPAALDELINELLAKDPGERPADVETVVSELRRIGARLSS